MIGIKMYPAKVADIVAEDKGIKGVIELIAPAVN